tara:strand:- start:200 stop:634 length:435 start_codon:yes stop_codon:yes gene_type:complete
MEMDKLDKVALLARSRENEAANALQRDKQALVDSNQRLEQLKDFKEEYELRLQTLAGGGIDARRLADYRRFLASLNDAINVQDQEVGRGQERVQTSQEEFVDKSLRRGNVDELIGRSRAARAVEEARREQKAVDEGIAARFRSE